VNRTVSFTIEDPYQKELLERSLQFPNFSAAVKRWLAGEPKSMAPPPAVTTLANTTPQAMTSQEPVSDAFDPVSALF
jgi:hypothetical protein